MDIQESIILFYSIWFVCSIFSNYILFLLFLCNFLYYIVFTFIIVKIPKLKSFITKNKDIITILFYIFVNITFWIMEIGSKLIKAFDEEETIYRKIELLFSIFVLCIGSVILLFEIYGPLLAFIKGLSRKIIIIPISIFIGIGMYFFIKKLDSYKGLPDIIVFILLVLLPICIFIKYGSYDKNNITNSVHLYIVSFLVSCIIGFYIYHISSNNKDEDKNISDDTSDEDNDENNNEDGDNKDEDTECDIAITTD